MAPDTASNPPGLASAQAAARLAADGPNELPRPPRRTAWRIFGEVAREPMFQLLALAVAIYLALGDLTEAGVLLAFVALIVGITLVQERRTERVLEALRDMTSPRALAWRDGQLARLPGRELVVGDVIELAEGDRVPADGRLLQAHDLSVDESLLSGESLPVAKQQLLGEVFAGTLVVAGQGRAVVTATGARSQIGRIGTVLGTLPTEATPLQRQTRQLVRWFSVLGLALSVVAGALYVWTRGGWIDGLLAGVTLAMSLLPQEFLLILTVFMAMGAWRLSQHRVLTRRAAAIEALGAATVLCTDKTGTLTHNRMAIAALVRCPAQGAAVEWRSRSDAQDGLPPEFQPLLACGVLACEREPFDPMERAFHALAGQHLPATPPEWQLVHEYPLAPGWPVMTHVWRLGAGTPCQVAAKGAPETLVRRCGLDEAQASQVLARAAQLADAGMRVLAVARAELSGPPWPAQAQDLAFELLGLVALADPLRASVPPAIEECRRAGIRVLMITGDHPGTALAIARQAGMAAPGGALTGAELAEADESMLQRRVAHTEVFARVAPQDKLRIVQALKARGEVVAMTGDGVNDAPSLRAAHIGIAMGGRGTDVAREAASLVLLDDDFATLVRAIRLGRRIDDNLRKAARFVLAVHVPIAGLTLAPLVLGWPLLFTPMHIAFLEIVIDPVCSIVFEAEPEEADVMRRPPRAPSAPLFSRAMMGAALLQGLLVLLLVGGFYRGLLGAGAEAPAARAAAFTALVACNIGLILANRSRAGGLRALLRLRNRPLWAMVGATAALLALVLGVPALRPLFGFAWPGGAALLAALAVAGGSWLLLLVLRRSR